MTPLVAQSSATALARIKVLSESGEVLQAPRVVKFGLRNIGGAAVSEAMYEGKPYVVRFGARVVGQLLKEENSSPQQSAPRVRLVGNRLEIGPGTIHPGQRLAYSLLIDGDGAIDWVSPLLNIRPRKTVEAHLLAETDDVVIYHQDGAVKTLPRVWGEYAWHRRPLWPAALAALFTFVSAALVIVMGRQGLLPSSLNPAPPPVTITITPAPPASTATR